MLSSNPATPYADVNTLIGGYAIISVAGVDDVVLSEAQAMHAQLRFSGTLAGDVNIILPAWQKTWHIENATTGAFTLTVKTSGGSGVTVTQSKKIILGGDGVDIFAWTAEI